MPGGGRFRAVLIDFGSARDAAVDVHSRAEALAVQEDAEAHCRHAFKGSICNTILEWSGPCCEATGLVAYSQCMCLKLAQQVSCVNAIKVRKILVCQPAALCDPDVS